MLEPDFAAGNQLKGVRLELAHLKTCGWAIVRARGAPASGPGGREERAIGADPPG
jgi:hypothetical protein